MQRAKKDLKERDEERWRVVQARLDALTAQDVCYGWEGGRFCWSVCCSALTLIPLSDTPLAHAILISLIEEGRGRRGWSKKGRMEERL